jgi:hypothetical protein
MVIVNVHTMNTAELHNIPIRIIVLELNSRWLNLVIKNVIGV